MQIGGEIPGTVSDGGANQNHDGNPQRSSTGKLLALESVEPNVLNSGDDGEV